MSTLNLSYLTSGSAPSLKMYVQLSCVRAFEPRVNKHRVVAIKPQSIRPVRRRTEMSCQLHATAFLASKECATRTIEHEPRRGPRRPLPPKTRNPVSTQLPQRHMYHYHFVLRDLILLPSAVRFSREPTRTKPKIDILYNESPLLSWYSNYAMG